MGGPAIIYGAGGPTGKFGSGGVYGGTSGSVVKLQLFDETGINPLPAGIFVKFYPANLAYYADSSLISAGWTEPLGLMTVSVPTGEALTAFFSRSFQAPAGSVTFTATGGLAFFPVTVPDYVSPSSSQEGYTRLQMAKLVNLWFGDAARSKGGIAYSIGNAYAAGIAALDAQVQAILAKQRLQYCLDGDIDSWSLDMVGAQFGRYYQGNIIESDDNFIARNQVMVLRPHCSIAYITTIVLAFYQSIAGEPGSIAASGQLGFGVAGGLDVAGGFDVNPPVSPPAPIVVPPVFVWDSMTEPGLATAYGIAPGQFVIQIGSIAASLEQVLAYNVSGGYNTGGGFSIVPSGSVLPKLSLGAPDQRLALLINWIAKGGGTQPLYLIGAPY